jgi:hypothetical protein
MHLTFKISKLDLKFAGMLEGSKFMESPLPTDFTPAKQETLNNSKATIVLANIFIHNLLESRRKISGF